jgi:hypothetical protein
MEKALMSMKAWSLGRYFTPGSRNVHTTQIAVPKQHLQFNGGKGSRVWAADFSYPAEASLGQTFVAEPKALAVIGKNTERGASFVAEDKKGSREGIAPEGFPGDPAQPIDALSEVDRLHVYENAHLWSDLDHRLSVRKAVMSGKNRVGAAASARISI